jgi:hypothetical protein
VRYKAVRALESDTVKLEIEGLGRQRHETVPV